MIQIPTHPDPDRTNNATNYWLKQTHSRPDPWRLFVRELPPYFPNPEPYARDGIYTPNDDIPF